MIRFIHQLNATDLEPDDLFGSNIQQQQQHQQTNPLDKNVQIFLICIILFVFIVICAVCCCLRYIEDMKNDPGQILSSYSIRSMPGNNNHNHNNHHPSQISNDCCCTNHQLHHQLQPPPPPPTPPKQQKNRDQFVVDIQTKSKQNPKETVI